jgi:O-antigen ligase
LFWISGAVQPTTPVDFTRTHFERIVARWPHSVVNFDLGSSIAIHAGLGLTLWIVADLSRDRTWLFILASVMVGTAVVVAFIALVQNQTHATGIFWRAEGRMPGRFWGPFFHHTSAGAYLNTVWPLAAGLTLASRRALSSFSAIRWAAVVAGLAFIVLLGAHTTHVSRFPQAAALVALPFLIWSLVRRHSMPRPRWIVSASLGILAIILFAGRTGEIGQRWRLLDFSRPATVLATPPESQWPRLVRDDLLIPNRYNGGAFGDRGEAQRTAWRSIMTRPLTGHGPGNWHSAASRNSSDPYVRSFYLYLQFAHEDFLQTWAEWGVAGFASLLLLLPGAVIVVLWNASTTNPVSFTFALCAAAGLCTVLLQSLLDFPLQIPAVALNATVLAGMCWSTAGSFQSHPSASSFPVS